MYLLNFYITGNNYKQIIFSIGCTTLVSSLGLLLGISLAIISYFNIEDFHPYI